MAATLTLEGILKAKDVIEKEIDVPEWEGKVKVRTLSLSGRYAINEYAMINDGKLKKVDPIRFAAATLTHGLIEPKVTFEEALKIAEKNAEVVESILGAIWEVSGLTGDELKNALPKG